jgi:Permuted papain-like amidase enzyme, YaeF/YiiX, C92 family
MKRKINFFLFLLFICIACKQNKKETVPSAPDPKKMAANYTRIQQLKSVMQSGDMIFRNGNDEVSRAARSFNRKDTSFSHCGLVFIENDSPFVYHALGGSYNPSQKLLRQPLDSFCNPAENNAVGIYRYPLTTAQLNGLQQVVHTYHKAGIKFDLFFNYLSDDEMYCAEFVFKALNKALKGSLSSYVRMDTIPFGVTTDDLFLHPNSQLIKREKFIY